MMQVHSMRTDVLIREKPVKLLLSLHTTEQTNTPNTIMGLSKASGMSFVHASNLLNELEAAGIVHSAKAGRTKRIALTPAGLELVQALEALMAKINQPPKPATAEQQPVAPSAQPATPMAEFPQPPEQSKKKLDELEQEKKE
jgi:predicted transcriptional regulator